MQPEQERESVERARRGDRSAFEGLIRAQARLVWACIHGMVRDSTWTEDLVQETFLRAWESLKDLKDPAAFRPWLLTTARRLAWRHAEVRGLPPPSPQTGSEPHDPEEAREQVQQALAQLPERYRIPVTLHFLNGMEYGAISQSLGLANGSLRGLIGRGIQKLRAQLSPWWRNRHEHP